MSNTKYTRQELFNMDAIEVYKLLDRRVIRRFPVGYWDLPDAREKSIKIIKYIIEDVLELTEAEDIKNVLKISFFNKYDLNRMFKKLYSSIKEVRTTIYPNIFK